LIADNDGRDDSNHLQQQGMKLNKKTALIAGGGLTCVAIAVVITLLVQRSGSGAGPLSTLSRQGQPVIDSSGTPVRPGQQQDATAFLFNSASDPVTLLSASLVPVPHQSAAKLAHAAVYRNHSYDAGGASSWPPHDSRIRPLHGTAIGHGRAGILFAITGPVSGHGYTMAAGIKITYRWHGTAYTVTAWSASVGCGDQLSSARCGQLTDQAQTLTIRQTNIKITR
jgi:hypothetical protein